MKPKPYKAKSLKVAQTYVRMLLKQRSKMNALLEKFAADHIKLAKLAATGPCFFNPLETFAAQEIRDEILRKYGLKPDGTILK